MTSRFCIVFFLSLWLSIPASATGERLTLIRDVASVEGVRENPLIGYGIVVGLKGTGDSRQTIFTMQTLANVLLTLLDRIGIPQDKLGNSTGKILEV